jgi:hypothetical protein
VEKKIKSQYKFATKSIKKRNGKSIYIPMAKQIGGLINLSEWTRIIKLYDTYELTTGYLDVDYKLTPQDCIDHIEGFKEVLSRLQGDEVEHIEMIMVSE